MKIGITIRGYRLQKGLSQGDIEKRTGLLRCYLSRVENGHTVPSLDTLAKIAQALDIPLAQFFAEDSLGREMNTQKLTDDELRFLTQIRRYATNLNDSDRKLLLAMVKKFAATAVRLKRKPQVPPLRYAPDGACGFRFQRQNEAIPKANTSSRMVMLP
jgi:transcriptional regulator with XRE-family HTH domain